MADVQPIRCSVLRGGTSRAVFFRDGVLPEDREIASRILLDIFGSPDVRQIDGLGGATSQTSKAAIVGPSSRADADVDYTFAQVSVTDALVDWGGNCGNISSAVGPFAIDEGLVAAAGDATTTVRIHNTNTGKIIVATVPVSGGRAALDGDYGIPGVPGSGSRILLEFTDPAGSVSGRLLPTGRPVDRLELAGGRVIEASIVDAGNPVVFLRAADLGMTGTELPAELEARTDVTGVLEEARSIAAEWLGLADRREATGRSPGLPKVGYVAPPSRYRTATGETLESGAADVAGRLMSMGTAHRSYMVTGGIATAAAAYVPGTIVHEAARPRAERPEPDTVRIAHPYGIFEAVVRADAGPGGQPVIRGIAVGRTARHILDGQVWVRRTALQPPADGRTVAGAGSLVAE